MLTLAGVLGHPVAHSRSPAMHNAAFAELRLDWRYVKLPVPPQLFDATVRALPASGYRGANVTIPHKLAALALANEASAAARAIGAANTLSFGADGGIAAENTDAGGFLAALGRDPRGLRALVLGAGGAARAVVWALAEAGAADVAIWNRTPERARKLAADLGARAIEHPRGADVVVNATSVGLHDDAHGGLPLAGMDAPETAVELVYRADGGETPFAAWAAGAGARVVDGLEILVRQGALSFELWTGRAAPLETMRRAVRGELPRQV